MKTPEQLAEEINQEIDKYPYGTKLVSGRLVLKAIRQRDAEWKTEKRR